MKFVFDVFVEQVKHAHTHIHTHIGNLFKYVNNTVPNYSPYSLIYFFALNKGKVRFSISAENIGLFLVGCWTVYDSH